MKNILKRKDKTSIFCPQSTGPKHVSQEKVKFLELIAVVIFVLGGFFIILFN